MEGLIFLFVFISILVVIGLCIVIGKLVNKIIDLRIKKFHAKHIKLYIAVNRYNRAIEKHNKYLLDNEALELDRKERDLRNALVRMTNSEREKASVEIENLNKARKFFYSKADELYDCKGKAEKVREIIKSYSEKEQQFIREYIWGE